MRKSVAKALKDKEFLGHPSGLFLLFFTEMWERFSYYGMRALLVLYMTSYLLLDPNRAKAVLGFSALESFLVSVFGPMGVQAMSSQIYGLYTGFVYFTPFFGGILADRVLGQYRTVYLGGVLMAIGHFLMASERMFLLALLFIILGNGCFKPNISTQVGGLYKQGDPRRDGAYAIYYMGINLGAFLAPLICGTLGQKVGWHWGFGAAGVGMIFGLGLYWFCSGILPQDTKQVVKKGSADNVKLTRRDWMCLGVLGLSCVLNILFWAIYEQQGNTLQLWADQKTDWHVLGFDIPSTWFQSFNPAMIFIFTPLLNMFWNWQAKRKTVHGSIMKMGIGCFLCGFAYLVLILAAKAVPGTDRGSVLWLAGTVFLFTMGELYLSPIGLSFVTKVAPRKIVSMVMGAWFLSYFAGNFVAGYLGSFYEKMPKDAFFLLLTALGVGTGIVFLVLRRPMEKIVGRDV